MSEFVEYLTEVFGHFGTIHAKKMFGGYGIYHDGIFFALVADEMLYLKSDSTIAHYFETKKLAQFCYDKDGKTIKMSYYLAPEEIYENRDEAAIWASRSFEAALRGKKAKR